jgi:hypothetical protein
LGADPGFAIGTAGSALIAMNNDDLCLSREKPDPGTGGETQLDPPAPVVSSKNITFSEGNALTLF